MSISRKVATLTFGGIRREYSVYELYELQHQPEARRTYPKLIRANRTALRERILREERAGIIEALDKSGWHRVKAARLLNMPLRTFFSKLKTHAIT